MNISKEQVDEIVQWAMYLVPHEDEDAVKREVVLLLLKYELEAVLGGPVDLTCIHEP